MTRMPLRLSFLFLVLLQVACGSDELMVRGEVTATFAGAQSGFDFPFDTNLAYDGVEQEVFAGRCQFQGEAVNLNIVRPAGPMSDEGLSRLQMAVSPAGVPTIDAMVEGQRLTAECQLDVLYSDECDGAFAAAMDCSLAADVSLAGELHFTGCDTL